MRRTLKEKIFTLTLSMLVIKILGFVFRIYLSNKIGAEGMGLYQLVLSVYALGATLSTSGITIALTRLIAINEKYAKKILKTGIMITGIIAGVVTLLTFINAEYIGIYFLKDERLIPQIRIVSLSFPAISLFSCLSGYFNGLSLVKYPVRGQITEQIARILFIFLVIDKAVKAGIKSALFVTTTGILLGEYLSLLYLYIKYLKHRRGDRVSYESKTFKRAILKISVPVSLKGYVSSFLHTIETMILPNRFILWGYTHKEAITLLGKIKGMAMPLIFFPTVIISSVSTIAFPYISKAQSENNFKTVKRTIRKTLFLAISVGMASFLFFFFFGETLCIRLYGKKEIAPILKALSITAPLMYVNIVSGGILNGLGKQTLLTLTGILEGAARTFMLYMFIPRFGFNGYLASILVSESITTLFYIKIIQKDAKIIKY